MVTKLDTTATDDPLQELAAIRLRIEDNNRFANKLGKKYGALYRLMQKFLGEEELLLDNPSEKVARAVARMLVIPLVAVWRDLGKDPNYLSQVADYFVSEWGYSREFFAAYIQELTDRVDRVSLVLCASNMFRGADACRKDVSRERLVQELKDIFEKRIFQSQQLSNLNREKFRVFFAILQEEKEPDDLRIYELVSELAQRTDEREAGMNRQMEAQAVRLANMEDGAARISESLAGLDVRFKDLAKRTESLGQMEIRLGTTEQRQAAADQAMSHVTEDMRSLHGHQEELRCEISKLVADCGQLRKRVTFVIVATGTMLAAFVGLIVFQLTR